MTRNLLIGAVMLAVASCAAPALATINPEYFDPVNGYVAGTPLSDYWTDGADDTTGVLDIVSVGGAHDLAVELTADGPADGSAFPANSALYLGWGGPGRASNKLWFAADVEKGSGTSGFIWQLSFARGNGANILTLDGGIDTFRLKTLGGTLNTGTFSLHNGWNQIGVLNDIGANPNTILYLDGVQVAALNVGSGPLTSGSTAVDQVNLTRQARGGPGDPFVATMRFDNIITANENILVPEPATFVLLGVGTLALVGLRRRRVAG
ncbi:MAG: PEP-CTERM sorting domain-containing protein [Planctomycetia bacterium]|nr:PEP-CTERM sorting domain-containing protein [Planctomycetia bacterium]